MFRDISRRELLHSALAATPALALGAAPAPLTPGARTAPLGADVVILDANVVTMDDRRPRAAGIAIRDGKFLAVGSSADARAYVGPGTKVLSLKGRTVLPGFIDAHCHVASSGRSTFLQIDFGLPTLAAIRKAIADAAATRPKGSWIVGNLYDDKKTDLGRFVTRFDIDDVSPDHPVLIGERSGHIAIANTAALRLAGLDRATPDPEGGKYDRAGRGELTGVMREHATERVEGLVPPVSREDARRAAVLQCQAMARSGLTTVHDAQTSEIDLLAYQDALARDELPIRVYALMQGRLLDHFRALDIRTGFGNDMLRIGPVKFVVDGAIAGRTAWLSRPYVGRPTDHGIQTMKREELDEAVLRAHRAGWQIGVHANGDLAIDMLLDAYEKALAAEPRADHRHRIEHCTLVNPQIVARMKRLGVIPTPFATYVYWHSDKWPEYGEDRLQWMFAHRTFVDAGIPVTGASDYIPGPFEPMMALQAMVTRRGKDGRVWGANQRVTIEQAIRIYTRNGAYASFDEQRKGSIEAGKLADLVVLGRDPLTTPGEELMQVPVERTMVGGRWVWET